MNHHHQTNNNTNNNVEPNFFFEDDLDTLISDSNSDSMANTMTSASSFPLPDNDYFFSFWLSKSKVADKVEPNFSDEPVFEQMMMMFMDDDSTFGLDQDDPLDETNEHDGFGLPSAYTSILPTLQEDVLVEPTPINTNLAVFVDKLPLEQLLSKQDVEMYDWFMRTVPSFSLETTEKPMLEKLISSTTSSSSSFVANMRLSNNNNTFTSSMMFRNSHQDVSWTTPLVPVHLVKEHILSNHHHHYHYHHHRNLSIDPQQLDKESSKEEDSNDESFDKQEETGSTTVSTTDSDTTSSETASSAVIADGNDTDSTTNNTLRTMHMELWNTRFQQLVQFKQDFGHCLVPLHWPRNPSLGHWVKRQRYQYRIKHERCQRSTLTDQREQELQHIGFTWDSHAAQWEERWNELRQFKDHHGHVKLPKKYIPNPQLPVWAKCQRRQYKLFQSGNKSHMTKERIEKLKLLGFQF